jgi:diaminopimelate decarboxylase
MSVLQRWANFFTPQSLPPSHWGGSINHRGHLEIDGCDVVAVASDFETPLHLVSKQRLLQNCHHFTTTLNNTLGAADIFYSYKTNCIPGILALLHQQGFGAEVISPYELWLALQLGVPGERIIFNGPHKTKASLEAAVRHNVKLINIDSLADLTNLIEVCTEVGMTANIGIRLCPARGWNAQFGLDMTNGEALEVFNVLAANSLLSSVKGVHIHLGSLIRELKTFAHAIHDIVLFLSRMKEQFGIEMEYFDIGGGFGVPTVREIGGIERRLCGLLHKPFSAPDPADHPGESDYVRTIVEALNHYISKYKLHPPQLLFEPGRLITSSAQLLLLSVKALKKRNPPAAILDGGKMTITIPTGFEYHEMFVANKMCLEPQIPYRLAGRTCTPSDIIYTLRKLPPLEIDDIIAIMDAGAYFTSFSNTFAYPRPCILLADNGSVSVLRDREYFGDLTSRDTILQSRGQAYALSDGYTE